jgi:hypothetical protein
VAHDATSASERDVSRLSQAAGRGSQVTVARPNANSETNRRRLRSIAVCSDTIPACVQRKFYGQLLPDQDSDNILAIDSKTSDLVTVTIMKVRERKLDLPQVINCLSLSRLAALPSNSAMQCNQ